MSISASAQDTSSAYTKLAGPSEKHNIDENNMVVNVKKEDKGGSFGNPSFVEDEDEEVMSSFNDPNSVADYESVFGSEEALVQFVIRESLLDLDVPKVASNDRKDKRLIKERVSQSKRLRQEVGESLSPLPSEPDANCSICMEPKFKCEFFSLKNCSHMYCSSCVSQYVEAKIEENVTSIVCPDSSCKDGYLEPEMCRTILKPEVFSRWGTALCESMIGSMKFYCPFKDCSALLIDERVRGEKAIKESECPHCFRLFCAWCKVPWHSGISCEDFAKLGDDERGREDVMLRDMAKKLHWQRCPKCKFYVERIAGCMFIKCRCGFQFCYGCTTPMTVDHYCIKCRR